MGFVRRRQVVWNLSITTRRVRQVLNATFQCLLAENYIKFYTSQNEDIKCAVVERFNRNLKSRIFKYFTYKSTSRYLDVVQQLVSAYNDSSTIRMTQSIVRIHNENEI